MVGCDLPGSSTEVVVEGAEDVDCCSMVTFGDAFGVVNSCGVVPCVDFSEIVGLNSIQQHI